MLVVHAMLHIDPDSREEALERISDLAEQSRAEEGVIDYRPAVDIDDPNTVRFFERYEDEAAFDAHVETDHFQEFGAVVPDLFTGGPRITQYDVSDSTDIEL